MEERKGLIRWIRDHKKQLIAVGISIGALLAAIWAIKHRGQLKALWDELKALTHAPTKGIPAKPPELTKEVAKTISEKAETVTQVVEAAVETSIENIVEVPPIPIEEVPEVISRNPFMVTGHPRTLHAGCHPSPAKIAEAKAMGITLLENQTWVDPYLKGGAA